MEGEDRGCQRIAWRWVDGPHRDQTAVLTGILQAIKGNQRAVQQV